MHVSATRQWSTIISLILLLDLHHKTGRLSSNSPWSRWNLWDNLFFFLVAVEVPIVFVGSCLWKFFQLFPHVANLFSTEYFAQTVFVLVDDLHKILLFHKQVPLRIAKFRFMGTFGSIEVFDTFCFDTSLTFLLFYSQVAFPIPIIVKNVVAWLADKGIWGSSRFPYLHDELFC